MVTEQFMETSIKMVYDELKELRKEVSAIRYSPIPEENVSSEELEEIAMIDAEMETGRKFKLDDILGEL